jgi:hypothetical protein
MASTCLFAKISIPAAVVTRLLALPKLNIPVTAIKFAISKCFMVFLLLYSGVQTAGLVCLFYFRLRKLIYRITFLYQCAKITLHYNMHVQLTL